MAQWFLGHPSWLMTDSQHIRVWYRFVHYKTDKIMEGLQFRSQVRIQCGKESANAAPVKDLEGNTGRLIQPLECEDYGPTIYHWSFLLSSYKTTKVNQSTCSFDMRISNWTFRRESRNFYKNTKVGVDYIDQILEMFITKFSTRRWPVALTPTGYCGTLGLRPPWEMEGWEGFASKNGSIVHNETGKLLLQELHKQLRSDTTHRWLVTAWLLDQLLFRNLQRNQIAVKYAPNRRTKSHGCLVCKGCHKIVPHVHCQFFLR